EGERQLGPAGQLVEPLLPVRARPLSSRGAARAALGEVAREAPAKRRQLLVGAVVEPRELGEQDAEAERVRDEHLDLDVDARLAAGEQRELDVEDLAALDVELPVREPLP